MTMSKHDVYNNSVIENFKFLKETKTTSHHEIFIPYILNYYHLIFSNLLTNFSVLIYIA